LTRATNSTRWPVLLVDVLCSKLAEGFGEVEQSGGEDGGAGEDFECGDGEADVDDHGDGALFVGGYSIGQVMGVLTSISV
jgi:hypothetical protein